MNLMNMIDVYYNMYTYIYYYECLIYLFFNKKWIKVQCCANSNERHQYKYKVYSQEYILLHEYMNIFYIKSNATKGTYNLCHKTYNFSFQ